MRRGNHPSFIKADDTIIGINLSSDFCAEHEWGIHKIKRALGVPEEVTTKNAGIKARTVTVFDGRLFFFDTSGDYSILVFLADRCAGDWIESNGELDLWPEELAAAWSSYDFGIVVAKPFQKFLKDLYEAFRHKDVALGFGSTLGIENAGLVLVIASLFSKEARAELRRGDISQIRLQRAAARTNIHKVLEGAGKRYFALIPRWKDEKEKEIIFWLNPYEQQENNFGWFTVQDLLDWADNNGPIPKQAKK